jgi:hypothetical protein
MTAKPIDRFEFERALWRQNRVRVAGVDEAGRGPLAGPVVAAAAILPSRWADAGLPAELAGLNDSKQLTETQREKYFEFLTHCAEIEFGIALVDAGVIDEINILQATHRAMNAALAEATAPPAPAALSQSMRSAPSIAERPSPDDFGGDAPMTRAQPPAKKKGGGLFGMFGKKESHAAGSGNPPLNSMDKMMVDAPAPRPAAPPAEPIAPALFISYSHADDATVTPLVAIVEGHGRTVWIDKTGLHTGDGWAGEIVKAIKAAHGVVVMCSKHSFASDHVKREVYLADKYKKPMAPLFLEQAAPPEEFEYFFANVQWLELWKLPEADRAAAIGQALKTV